CLRCPVAQFCKARKLGLTERIPEKRIKRAGVQVTLASLVLVDSHNQTLLLPPPRVSSPGNSTEDIAALLSRMLHFPTIHVKSDPAKELQAFAQKFFFKKFKKLPNLHPMPLARHTVTYRQITIHPFRFEISTLPRIPHAKSLPLTDLSSIP